MTEKQSSQDKQAQQTHQIAGYPEKPTPLWVVAVAVAACVLWLCFLLVMLFIRQSEWPI